MKKIKLNETSTTVNQDKIIEYYTQTTADYKGWSKGYNMHFGYFSFKNWKQCFKEIWRLEPQLEQANQEVFQRLNIQPHHQYLDMGCGAGATARNFAKHYSTAKLTGITIVQEQVDYARKLLAAESPDSDNITFEKMDYQYTSFESESFDGVYAMESACHAKGLGKAALLKEAHRLLKPGGKFVVHDAFTMQSPCKFNFVYRYAYYWLCKGWAVEDYIDKAAFEEQLQQQGFSNIQFKNAFWNVLPSALHIPRVVVSYIIVKMLFSKAFYTDKTMRKQRINHCLGSIAGMFVPLHTKRFGYYIVTAEK